MKSELIDRLVVCKACGSLLEARSSYKSLDRIASWCPACAPDRPQSGSIVRVVDESRQALRFRAVEPPRPASMADQLKFVFENAERLLEEHGVYCVRRLNGDWVLDATNGERPITASGPSLYEAYRALKAGKGAP